MEGEPLSQLIRPPPDQQVELGVACDRWPAPQEVNPGMQLDGVGRMGPGVGDSHAIEL
jgi:hypothetical protein